jgi:excisionase family DNA binding protein
MLLTAKEVARDLGVCLSTVYKRINEGELRAIVVGGKKIRRLRIEQKDLDVFKRKHETMKEE